MGAEKLRRVLSEHEAFARRMLRMCGVRAADVDDVLQEVRIGVARGLEAFEPRSGDEAADLRAWLVVICRRQAAQHHKAGAKRAEHVTDPEELQELLWGEEDGEQLAHEHKRAVTLVRLLAEVAPNERQAVIGYELEGLTMGEVADIQGVPVNTAWDRKRRGLLALTKAAKRVRS
jgi:RNA polymerase sigma-70 factor (ECF subfamily)